MGPGPSGPWSEQRAVASPVLSPSLQMSPGQLLLLSQCVGSESTSRSIFPSPSVPSVWGPCAGEAASCNSGSNFDLK